MCSTTAKGAEDILRLVNTGCKLVGCGSAVPSLRVSNNDLPKIVDINDDWISVWTGIHNRRVLSGKENLTDLAIEAAWKALEMADVPSGDIDLILMCSSTGDDHFGSASVVLRSKKHWAGKAIHWLLTLRLLVAGSYWACFQLLATSKVCDIREDGLFGFDLHSDGDGKRHLISIFKENETDDASNENHSVTSFPPKCSSYSYLQMNVKEIFKFVVRVVPQSIEAALEKAGLASSNNFDWLLFHQAKQRIINGITTWLEVPSECVISNLANYGNTSIASIPLALDKVVRSGKAQSGHVIAAAGFGAGLTWASIIFRWG